MLASDRNLSGTAGFCKVETWQKALSKVVAQSVSFEESEWWANKMSDKPWIKTPWTIVSDALWESLGGINGAGGGPFSPPEGTLRVVVAPRL